MKSNKDEQNQDGIKKTPATLKAFEKGRTKSCCTDKKCSDKCAEDIVNAFKHMDNPTKKS